MTIETLEKLLAQLGARKDGPAHILPQDADVTFLVALEGETLSVAKVTRAEVQQNTALIAQTSKGEHFAFAIDRVCAIKVDRSEAVKRERGAGFAR
jgi:hypothetical protein